MSNSGADSHPLSGQVAIVTGGGRGIGRAVARALARAGARVAVAARSREQVAETISRIQQDGGQALPFVVDVTGQAAVERMVRETERQFGPVDLLVNNAGLSGHETSLWEEDAADWWRVVEVNLRGPFLCARAVLPGMVERKRGRIINMVSGAGAYPFPFNSAYPVSKAALFRLTDCIAEMTNPHGVYVFAISPGLVRTAMTQDMEFFKNVPANEWYEPEQAGGLCVQIALGVADRLSGRYINVADDLQAMVQRADEIVENDLFALRMRR